MLVCTKCNDSGTASWSAGCTAVISCLHTRTYWQYHVASTQILDCIHYMYNQIALSQGTCAVSQIYPAAAKIMITIAANGNLRSHLATCCLKYKNLMTAVPICWLPQDIYRHDQSQLAVNNHAGTLADTPIGQILTKTKQAGISYRAGLSTAKSGIGGPRAAAPFLISLCRAPDLLSAGCSSSAVAAAAPFAADVARVEGAEVVHAGGRALRQVGRRRRDELRGCDNVHLLTHEQMPVRVAVEQPHARVVRLQHIQTSVTTGGYLDDACTHSQCIYLACGFHL